MIWLSNRLHRIKFFLLLASVAMLPYALYGQFRIFNVLIWSFVGISLISSSILTWRTTLQQKVIWAALAYFAVQLIFYLVYPGLQNRTGWISLSLIIPTVMIAISLLQLSANERENLLVMFAVSIALSVFTVLVELPWMQHMDHIQYEKLMVMHRPYYGLHLLFAMCIGFHFLMTGTKKVWTSVLIIWSLICIAAIYAKMTWVTLLVLLPFIAIGISKELDAKQTRLILITTVVIGLAAAIATIVVLKTTDLFDGLILASFSDRMLIWSCALDSISTTQEFLIGNGYGSEIKLIDKCFIEHDAVVKGYNAHNQFLSSIINAGTLGLLSLLLLFFYFLKSMLNTKGILGVCFAVIIIFGSMTESILVRANGVLFFSIIASILAHPTKETTA